WNDNSDASKEDRFRMFIYREHGTMHENIVACLPIFTPESCNVVNQKGQEVSEPTRIVSAVKRGNFLVAVTTNGYLHFWKLDERHHSPTENDIRGLSGVERLERNRSLSMPVDPILIARRHAHTISGNADEKRRSGKRSN